MLVDITKCYLAKTFLEATMVSKIELGGGYLENKTQRKEEWLFGREPQDVLSWVDGESRGLLYSFLSAVFNDEVSVDQVADSLNQENVWRLGNIFDLLPEEKGFKLKEGIKNIQKRWGEPFSDEKKEKENLDLRREFAYLFLTPHGVNPFESIYRGKKKLLMDKPWEEVRKFYRSIGVEKEKSQLHPEDHIAIELGLMAALSYMSGRFLLEEEEEDGELGQEEKKRMLQIQCTFLEQHLSRWVPQLSKDIMEKTRHPFYSSVAELTAEFIEADLYCLQEYFSNDNYTNEGR